MPFLVFSRLTPCRLHSTYSRVESGTHKQRRCWFLVQFGVIALLVESCVLVRGRVLAPLALTLMNVGKSFGIYRLCRVRTLSVRFVNIGFMLASVYRCALVSHALSCKLAQVAIWCASQSALVVLVGWSEALHFP